MIKKILFAILLSSAFLIADDLIVDKTSISQYQTNNFLLFDNYESDNTLNGMGMYSDTIDISTKAIILGSSIFLITASKLAKAKLALVKCAIWMAFGFLTLYHVGNNFITGQVPHHIPITLIGAIALIGNILSTLLLLTYKNKDVNLKSAYICCRNDALGNLLIIIAGLLIMRTGTNWPDLIVGTMIGLLVVYSAAKITKESLIILQEKKS